MSDEERDESTVAAWQRLRQAAAGMLESDPVAAAFEMTKDLASASGQAAASAYTGAKQVITQAEAWEQIEETLLALTDVARVQHAMILDLMDRVAKLEGSTSQNNETSK